MGHILDSRKKSNISRCTNVDTLDVTPFKSRPVNDPKLEGINAAGFCLYVNIGSVAYMVDVMLNIKD